MGRFLVFVAGAVLAYVGSGYLEGLLSKESDTETAEQGEA